MLPSRFLAIAVSAFGLLMSAPTDGSTPRDVLVVASQIDDLSTLDPAEIFEYSGAEFAANVYDRLVGYDPGDWTRPAPRLAHSLSVDPSGRLWRFDLRRDAAFRSGRAVDADDVAYALRRALHLGKAPVGLLRQIGLSPDGLRVIDRETL